MSAILTTILLAASPLVELRGAIPYAVFRFGFSAEQAYFWAVAGNLLPIFLILLLGPAVRISGKYIPGATRFFAWLFLRTRAKNETKFRRFKEFALVLLVAVPLPVTGAWTGSVAAFVFGIPFTRAFPLIALGVLIAGVAVTLLTFGVQAIL